MRHGCCSWVLQIPGAIASEKRNRWSITRGLLLKQGGGGRGSRRSVKVVLLTSRSRLLERRRRCNGSSSLAEIAHSGVLDWRCRRCLQSRVSSMLLLALRGRSDARFKGCTRRRRSTLGLDARLAGIRRSRVEHKIRVVREVQRCCGKPRGLGLDKPFLLMIRDERL